MKQVVVILFSVFALQAFAQDAARIDSIEQVLPSAEGEAKLDLLSELCVYYASRNTEKSMEYSMQGIALSRAAGNKKKEALFRSRSGIMFRRMARYDSAEHYYNSSLELATAVQDTMLITQLHNNLGYMYKVQGEVDLALSYYNKALDLHEKYGTEGQDMVLINIGNIYKKQGKEGEAMENFMEALAYYESIDDQRGRARAYNNLNLLFRDFDKLDDALKYAEMALEINIEIEDKRGMAISYNNVGIIHDIKDETAQAIEAFTKGYLLADELGLKSTSLSIVSNLGQAHWTAKDDVNALFYFEQTLKLSEEIGYEEGLVHSYNNIGMVYQERGEFQKAIEYFEKSLNANDETMYNSSAATSHKSLSDCYAGLGRYELAFDHRVQYDTLSAGIKTSEQAAMVEEMQTKYETEKKDAENKLLSAELNASEIERELIASKAERKNAYIWGTGIGAGLLFVSLLIALFAYLSKRKTNVLLEEQNAEIERQRNDVMKLNVTKDKLLSIVAHDLKNPFGILQSMTRMLIEKYDTLKEEQKKEIVSTVYKSFNSTYDLVENLLQWSRAQTKGLETNPEQIDLSTMVDKNFTLVKLLAAKKNIELNMAIDPTLSVVADANMINTVCRNLLTNAIKFTGDNGKVTVKAEAVDNQVEIVFEDTGIGVKQEDIAKLFKIETNPGDVGNSPEKGTGLGLVLCHDFVTANGGSISMESEVGKGSVVRFRLVRA